MSKNSAISTTSLVYSMNVIFGRLFNLRQLCLLNQYRCQWCRSYGNKIWLNFIHASCVQCNFYLQFFLDRTVSASLFVDPTTALKIRLNKCNWFPQEGKSIYSLHKYINPWTLFYLNCKWNNGKGLVDWIWILLDSLIFPTFLAAHCSIHVHWNYHCEFNKIAL